MPRYEAFNAAFAPPPHRRGGPRRRLPLRAGYPERLRDLPDPPAVLHVAGSLGALPAGEAVAIVGSRRATPYGLEVSSALGRALTARRRAGGLRHGARDRLRRPPRRARRAGGAAPVAVLAGGAEIAYPARMRHLHARLIEAGAVVSEMPPGFGGHRWCFPARNRIIAALSTLTIVVEAATRSGSLITADLATDLGRTVAAVPGPVTSAARRPAPTSCCTPARPSSATPATCSTSCSAPTRRTLPDEPLPPLEPAQRRLLDQVERGHGTVAELARTMEEAQAASRTLSELELLGLVRREFGGGMCGAWTRERGRRGLLPSSACRRIPAVLSIAGSDSGGGAGIQADLKAFARCGVHGMTAITALTAQNTTGVSGVHTTPPDFIVEQVRQVATTSASTP